MIYYFRKSSESDACKEVCSSTCFGVFIVNSEHISQLSLVFLLLTFLGQPQACNFIKKEVLAQLFSCEFCEIFNNTFFTETLRWLLLVFGSL